LSKKVKNKDKNHSVSSTRWHSMALILDKEARIKFITKDLSSLLGFTVTELLGRNAIEILFVDSEHDERKSQLDFLYKQESVVNAFDAQLKNKDGSLVNLRFGILKLSSVENDTEDIALIGDDLSTTSKIVDAVIDPESQLAQLVDSAREFIIIIDAKEQISNINQVGIDKLGIKTGMFLRDLLEPVAVKKTSSFLDSLGKISSTANINLVFLHPGTKERFYLDGTVTSIVVNDKMKEFRLILHDVTEQIKTEKAKDLYYSIAHHSIHSKDLEELYYNIHKELKTVVDCENMYIALKENNNGENILSFPYYQEGELQHFENTQRKFGRGITEYIIQQEEPQLLTKKDLLKLEAEKAITLQGKIPEIWLGVPLKVQSEVIGAIAVQSYHSQSIYSSRDLKLLDFASSQIAIAIDMVRTQEKLKVQTAKLNSIIESSSHLIWTVNEEFELTSFNKNYFEAIINNYDIMPAMQGDSPDTSKESHSFWEDKYRQALAGEQLNFEIKLKDKNGSDIWKEIYLNPIYLDGDRIEEVSGIANDITEKKKAGEALSESEEKFRNIFESFQDVYFRCDRNGIISMVSPSVKELTGLDVKKVIGRNIVKFYKHEGPILPLLKNLIDQQQIKNVESTVVNAKGELIECICNLSIITDTKNNALFIEGVVRDVTLLKLTNKELIEAKDLAESSLMVKEQFLANMSHEIRTPLNGIIGVIDLLEQTQLAKEQGSYLKTIKASSETLLNILNDILDLSKIEAGKMELRAAPLSPKKLINKLKSLFASRATTHLIKLQFHLSKNVPQVIEADEMRLIQVISNLIANSIKFTPRGGSIDIGLKLIADENDNLLVRVDVRDSGIGIKKEDLEKLFTNFTQLDTSTTKSYAGTGLGLSISKQLVEIMGGKINVTSNPGLGSTFWFTFGAKRSYETVKYQEEQRVIKDGIKKFTDLIPSILVVDDNLVNRDVAGEILKKSGCHVDLAANGIEAVYKAKANNYDIIFMDIQMPEMDGIEANKQIKKLNLKKQPLVVAMTAYSLKEDEERILDAGLDEYLAKPVRANQLIGKVEELFMGSKTIYEELEDENKELQIVSRDTINQLQKYGGIEMVFNALKEFEEEAKEQIQECYDAIEKDDFDTIQKHLHTLKGSAGTLGIEKIAQIALEIEAEMKVQDYSNVTKGLLELSNNFAEFKENFTNIISHY
jgi:PAS domain S-box-containing protein